MKKIFKFLFYFLLLALAVLSTFMATLYLGGFGHIPSESELLKLQNENASLIYSSDGKLIGKFFSENRTDVSYDSLPTHLIQALIATEDARFYEHAGLDGQAFLRVFFKSLLLGHRSSGGGSTLSQQLAKNLFGRKDYGKISLGVNKAKEIILANRLENIYSKEEILELYLNTVPFGENIFGIEVAAQRFFSCPVQQLKVEQAAVLVGMLKANTRYNPRIYPENALERRAVVLGQMSKYKYLSESDLDSLIKLDLGLRYSNVSRNESAPYFLEQLQPELKRILQKLEQDSDIQYDFNKDGLIIKSTLNDKLQKAAERSMRKHLSKMQGYMDKLYAGAAKKGELLSLAKKIAKREKLDISNKNKKTRNLFYWQEDLPQEELSLLDSMAHSLKQLQGGILGLNPKNGALECWLGGVDFSHYPYDQILAKRQLASTFKPILYAQALIAGSELCDYLSNESIVLSDFNNWAPANYDGKSGGSYSLAAALAYSKNLPTVHLYFQTDVQALAKLWSDLGFVEKLNEGPSVILGTNSVSMLELATAYAVFANGGKLVEPYTIESIQNSEGELIYQKPEVEFEQVMDSKVTVKVNAILKKAINSGTGASIRGRYGLELPLAGKTGTSQDFADAWFVGYNSGLVWVSRVGASFPGIHFNSGAYGSGSKLALPLIALTLKESLKDPVFSQRMYGSFLNAAAQVDCPDRKEEDLIDKAFRIFQKKETNLKRERKRAEKKKKVKSFFKAIFGE